ncbi:hypothetical protein PUNSTDRAFT_36730, partial [Punctularia strigosozonata HHB-11173 SS5]|uniref:uncharacterized protein n=1 Tax=Punctularia strigosozonata (strain HHB-11173) TaxID=741275 RepID=UPI0004417ECD
LENMDVRVCSCTSAASFLVSRGFFPCAPQAPSVAFDINMMELVATLFLRVAPNITAWASTLETFLGARQFKLRTRYSVRRRLGNTLNWYMHLTNCVTAKVDEAINAVRSVSAPFPPSVCPGVETSADSPPQNPSCDAPTSASEHQQQPSSPLPGSHAEEARPSLYLRSRCPLCFAGVSSRDESMEFDVIVCIDACFSQKRRSGPRDPMKVHPDTFFMPDAEVKAMEDFVAECRSKPASSQNDGKGKGKKRAAPDPTSGKDATTEPDKCEGPLQVPNSVLDGCEASFKAADERREKASTTFFDDTGLVALLCRHDCTLWVANMTSAGERQHYALALINKLFQHIPVSWRAGILYDIGCQIHRSVFKWGFLCDIRDRITFAISVLHAYGHQWPCQCCYHPRKCSGFGLSDGEGCERLWSALNHLVSVLRGSGYYQRRYLLDCQLLHLISKHLLNLAVWLSRRHEMCRMRLSEAEKEIRESGIDEESLRAEWANQRAVQTKPIPRAYRRQSKNAGTKYVEVIIALDERIRELDRAIADGNASVLNADPLQALDYQTLLEDDRMNARKKLAKFEGFLDEPALRNLQALRKDLFLGRKANALALKTRIREKLRQRKFELSRIEQLRSGRSSERKLHGHTATAVQRRETGIRDTVQRYNALCREMDALIKKGQAPAGAVTPATIDVTTFWKLDVDDPIWQDTGLLDDDDHGATCPVWLSDKRYRNGIRAMLERDRCREELARIYKERGTMQSWLLAEW